MQFKDLVLVKKLVATINKSRCKEDIEFWFPHMYDLGKWGCTIVFSSCEDQSYVQPFLDFFKDKEIRWFISTIKDDIAIHIQ